MFIEMLRLPDVKKRTGQSRSAIYTAIQKGKFVPPVRLSERSVGWPANEVEALNTARIAGMGQEAIRELVLKLIASRSHVRVP